MTKEIATLERLALDAHQAGVDWKTFWDEIQDEVRAAEPHDRQRYRRLFNRLLALWSCGDTSGQVSVGDDEPAPWERDDAEHEPADVGTAARLQTDVGSTAAAIVQRCQAQGAAVTLASWMTNH